MKRKYRLPIQGTVIKKEPLTGDGADPICTFPLAELPNLPTYFNEESQQEQKEPFGYSCLDYNIDEEWCEVELEASEEFHNWLVNIIPQLRNLQEAKGWRLNKAGLEGK